MEVKGCTKKPIAVGLLVEAGPSPEERREALSKYFFTHTFPPFFPLPCGHAYWYPCPAALPLVDTLCSCGNPRHWVVKYSAPPKSNEPKG